MTQVNLCMRNYFKNRSKTSFTPINSLLISYKHNVLGLVDIFSWIIDLNNNDCLWVGANTLWQVTLRYSWSFCPMPVIWLQGDWLCWLGLLAGILLNVCQDTAIQLILIWSVRGPHILAPDFCHIALHELGYPLWSVTVCCIALSNVIVLWTGFPKPW